MPEAAVHLIPEPGGLSSEMASGLWIRRLSRKPSLLHSDTGL